MIISRKILAALGQPRGENWFWRIIHSRREEQVVYLDNPVPLTVGE